MIHIHNYKRLIKNTSPCNAIFIQISFILVIIAISHAVIPLLVQQTLSAAFLEKNIITIQNTLLVFTALILIRGFASYFSRVLTRKACHCLSTQLCTSLFDVIVNLPIHQQRYFDTNQVTKNALFQINEIAGSITQMLSILVRDTLIIIVLVLCLSWLNKDFAGLFALLIPFTLIMQHIVQKHRHISVNSNQPDSLPLITQLQHLTKYAKLIRLHGAQNQEYQHLKAMLQSEQNSNANRANYSAFIATVCQLITLLIATAITYLMIQMALRDQFTADQFAAFAAAALLLIAPINRMAGLPQSFQDTKKHLQQIFQLLDQPAISEQEKTELTKAQGKLAFKHASFLNQSTDGMLPYTLDLEIKPNETIAFVCKCQKMRSLLIDLLLGFQKPKTGQILFDDIPIEIIKHTDLFTHFAIVSHDPVIMSDTIAGNIAYGYTACAHEANITAVSQAVGVTAFVREMPNGLQTYISPNGPGLTCLQRQKIDISRALLKNPTILILDNLWLQPNQTDLNQVLATLVNKPTTIILLDSIPAIKHPIDRIFLFNNGQVTEYQS